MTLSDSWKEPYEAIYMDPVFDNSDANNDGVLDNPDLFSITNLPEQGRKLITILMGISATISIPLDKRHNEGCLKAADTESISCPAGS